MQLICSECRAVFSGTYDQQLHTTKAGGTYCGGVGRTTQAVVVGRLSCEPDYDGYVHQVTVYECEECLSLVREDSLDRHLRTHEDW